MSDSQPKITRGQKMCKKCETINGVRAFVCKDCGAEFKMKKRRKHPRRIVVDDFRTLQPGDTVRVMGASGPFHTDSNGDRSYLVERGKYKVVSTDQNGIHAYGEGGYGYLYMGSVKTSKLIDTITHAPCKIFKLSCPIQKSKPN